MRKLKYTQLIGEIVELKDSYRIYDRDGVFYITDDKETAYDIAHAILTGVSPNMNKRVS